MKIIEHLNLITFLLIIFAVHLLYRIFNFDNAIRKETKQYVLL